MSQTVSPAMPAKISAEEWRGKIMHKCRESVDVKQKFFEHYADQIGELSQKMAARFQAGRKLWVMGNGGSACDAQHVAVEFIHPIIEKRKALPAFDLVSQIPVVTAISNDKDFARVFVDQIELWGQ
jgi:D-sedoheptulose 7-phosphate isomerase